MSQPVSWLALEQYLLGEISETDQQRIERHLHICAACAQDLKKIKDDLRVLKPLPEMVEKPDVFTLLRNRWAIAVGGLAAVTAAVAILFAWMSIEQPARVLPANHMSYKGGELAMMVVRERNGVVTENPSHFAPGDNIQLFLTHAAPEPVDWEVVVLQGNEVYFPVPNGPPLPAGNLVPVPGAFRLTGDLPSSICLLIGGQIPTRNSLREKKEAAFPASTVCTELKTDFP